MSHAFDFAKYIDCYPDFPEPGILFRDISPLLRDVEALQALTQHLSKTFSQYDYDVVCGIDARGLIFASLLALHDKKSFVMVRKSGKLPGKTLALNYQLEYGKNQLEIQYDAIKPHQKVLIIDDVLATGGTAKVAAELIEALQGKVVGIGFAIELTALNGRDILNHYPVHALLQY